MTFTCQRGCSSCCGPVPIPLETYERNKRLVPKGAEVIRNEDSVITFFDDGKCGFLSKITNRCKIYNERPEVCRKFGEDMRLPFPYLKPDGTKRTLLEQKLVAADMDRNIETMIEFIKKK